MDLDADVKRRCMEHLLSRDYSEEEAESIIKSLAIRHNGDIAEIIRTVKEVY